MPREIDAGIWDMIEATAADYGGIAPFSVLILRVDVDFELAAKRPGCLWGAAMWSGAIDRSPIFNGVTVNGHPIERDPRPESQWPLPPWCEVDDAILRILRRSPRFDRQAVSHNPDAHRVPFADLMRELNCVRAPEQPAVRLDLPIWETVSA